MADTFELNTTVNHICTGVDDFSGTGNIRDTIQTYIGTKPAGSYVRFIYDENPPATNELKVKTLMYITATSIAEISTAINQIDNNLGGLPGTYRRRHVPKIQDSDFGDW